MQHARNPEPLRHFNGVVAGGVVDEQQVVYDTRRNFGDRPLEGAAGVVGGQHDHHPLSVDHVPALLLHNEAVRRHARKARLVLVAGVRPLLDLDHLDFLEHLEAVATGREKDHVAAVKNATLQVSL